MPRPTDSPVDTHKRQRPTVVGVRVLPDEDEAIQRLADREKTSKSAILRRALLRELNDRGAFA